MSNQEQLESVELQQFVAMGEALGRLEQNPDFKLVILERYMKDKALDAVSLLAVDQIKKSGRRPDVMEELVAISALGDYFRMIKNFHEGALNELSDDEG